MKIGYFADGPWSHIALEKILEQGQDQISFIVPRFDKQDEILRHFAERIGVPFLPIKNVNSDESCSFLGEFGSDIFVSMSFNQIIRKKLLVIPRLGFINCHAGALPFYRGRNILNWVLINGEKHFGVTVHYIDEGIDTGDIIAQDMVPILECDDYGSLLEKAYVQCAATLVDSLDLIRNNRVKPIKQSSIHPVGSYCKMRKSGDERLNWNQTSTQIRNFVRGIKTPGPCARTIDRLGREWAILETSIFDGTHYEGLPGQIVGRTDSGILVKTSDSVIELKKIAAIQKDQPQLGELGDPNWSVGEQLL